ncbi:MAG: hypothetical protein AMJ43_06760 [Coxiella sp. DG_40]|nr:MAG: hypothetical protein AMJ43_06760 [Coxiella sp. DG_40]
MLGRKGFSLIEAMTALIILALVSSTVLVVINRCMTSAANLAIRMQAFEVARENMETLLSKDSVEEMAEFGSSDKYPEIRWQNSVEMFYEPITARMWVRAICSAEYTDTEGQVQTVELTHWLTDLTKMQLIQMIKEKQEEKKGLAEQDEDEQDRIDEQKDTNEPEDVNRQEELGGQMEQMEGQGQAKEREEVDEEDEMLSDYELEAMSFDELISYLNELSNQ